MTAAIFTCVCATACLAGAGVTVVLAYRDPDNPWFIGVILCIVGAGFCALEAYDRFRDVDRAAMGLPPVTSIKGK